MKRLFSIILIACLTTFFAGQGWGADIVAKPDANDPRTIMYKMGNLTNCSDADSSFTTTGTTLRAAYIASKTGCLSICPGDYPNESLNILDWANEK